MASFPKIQTFDIIGGSNQLASPAWDSQYSLNWYPYYDPIQKEWAQYPYTGSQLVAKLPVGDNPTFVGRPNGLISTDSLCFAVVGSLVYQIDTNFDSTLIGTIDSTSGQLKMDLDGAYLIITDGASSGWSYQIVTGSWAALPGPPGPTAPTYVCDQDGYPVFNDTATGALQTMTQGGYNDPTSFYVTNNIQVNYKSSFLSYPLIAMESINGRIFAFTTGFIVGYENVGAAGFTFQRDENLIYGYGLISAGWLAKGIGGSKGEKQPEFLIFGTNVDGTNKIMLTTGADPIVISTPAIELELTNLTMPTDCTSFIWSYGGQVFYEISFNTDNLTLVYNKTSDRWFHAQTLGNRHFAQCYTFFNGKRLALSNLDNGLYELSEAFPTDFGNPITRRRITKNIRAPGYRKFTVHNIWLYCQQGIGLPGGVNPNGTNYVYGASGELLVYVSRDGGETFEQPIILSFGEVGRYNYVTTDFSLGEARDLTFKFEVTQPIQPYLMGMEVTMTVSESTQ